MPEFDHGGKIIARESGQALARLAGFDCRSWKPIESTLQVTTERLADRAFVAKQGRERFVVYFEFVSQWDSSVPWSVLVKSGILAQRERLPVASLIFVLRPDGYVPQNGTIRLEIAGHPVQQIWFIEKTLWTIRPESWWETEPGLMAIYPLVHHGKSPKDSILHAAARIEDNESDRATRADLLTTLGIFGRMAYPDLDALSLIGREKMKESLAYQEILAEGRESANRIAIMTVVETRFGKRGARAFKPVLESVHTPARLQAILKLAAKCDDIGQLLAAVKT